MMCITRVPSNAELNERANANPALKTKEVLNEGKKTSAPGLASPALSIQQCLVGGVVMSALVTLFSLYHPFWLAPIAAAKTYFLAFYTYDEETLHHFDTTIWTYGSDYGLAIVMLFWSWRLYQQSTPDTLPLCQRIWGLIVGYAISTTAGALAHQNYPDRESRNTWHFRLLWTVCVGSVTFASQPMGCIAAEVSKQFQPHTSANLPQIPELLWRCFAITTTAVCAMGWFSYHRPACDIFIAGQTQTPTSFFLMFVLWKIKSDPNMAAYIHPRYLWMAIISFVANAPLLPVYPLLVQYTDMSLAQVNSFLHSYLLVSWSIQAISLTQIQKAVATLQQRPPKAVPLAKKES